MTSGSIWSTAAFPMPVVIRKFAASATFSADWPVLSASVLYCAISARLSAATRSTGTPAVMAMCRVTFS